MDLISHDVKTAFLYSSLKPDEEIYLKRPKGVTDDMMSPIVELKKYLYGLLQASKYFDEHLSATLLSIGFIRFISDAEVFILREGDHVVFLSKHVDECLLAGTKGTHLLAAVSAKLAETYKMTTII